MVYKLGILRATQALKFFSSTKLYDQVRNFQLQFSISWLDYPWFKPARSRLLDDSEGTNGMKRYHILELPFTIWVEVYTYVLSTYTLNTWCLKVFVDCSQCDNSNHVLMNFFLIIPSIWISKKKKGLENIMRQPKYIHFKSIVVHITTWWIHFFFLNIVHIATNWKRFESRMRQAFLPSSRFS